MGGVFFMDIISLINSVGFPIFACIYLVKNNEKLIDSINDLSITLKGIDTRLEIIERKQENAEDIY